MNTTTLIVDYLIIGIESCGWIFLFLAIIARITLQKDWMIQLTNIPVTVVPILLGLIIVFVYAIGILTNEIYNVLFKVCNEYKERRRILEKKFPDPSDRPEGWNSVRDYVSVRNCYIARRYDIWELPKIRILRATSLNFFLIGFCIFVHSWVASGHGGLRIFDIRIASITLTFWVITGFALWQWHHRMTSYYNHLADSYISLQKLGMKAKKNRAKTEASKEEKYEHV